MSRRAATLIVTATIVIATLAATAASPANEETEKKFTPRLPPYFAAIVTPSQRK